METTCYIVLVAAYIVVAAAYAALIYAHWYDHDDTVTLPTENGS